jgi:multimeric flavodoxin WrbA
MKKNKIVVINASARNDGNTSLVINYLSESINFDTIHLCDFEIGHFDYEFGNQHDDFLPLIKRIINDYDLFIFATPVYWYTMSGHLKVFFDRISDLLKIQRPIGRLLKCKKMGIISNSGDNNLVKGFYEPFKATADY